MDAELQELLGGAENPPPSGPSGQSFVCNIDAKTDGSARLRRNAAGHSEQIVDLMHRANIEAAPYHALLDAGGPHVKDSATDYVEQYLAEMQPRNLSERMLAVQMLWQHARLARLVRMESGENRCAHIKTLSAAIDSAMAVYRRQAATWQDLRTPRPVQFIRGEQVNMAEKQVIASGPGLNSNGPANSANKQGSTDEHQSAAGPVTEPARASDGSPAPALPFVPEWAGFAPRRDKSCAAVAAQHRTANARR